MIGKKKTTFENVSLKQRRVELEGLIAVLDHVLVKLQLTIAKRSVTEKQQQQQPIPNQSIGPIHLYTIGRKYQRLCADQMS